MRILIAILCFALIGLAKVSCSDPKRCQEEALEAQERGALSHAFSLFQKACEGGEAMACFYLGNAYEKGLGIDADHQKAKALWQKANTLYQEECDKGKAESCYVLAQSHYYGKGNKVDLQKAIKLWEKACELGDAGGCNDAGLLYVKGEGVQANPLIAKKLFERSCKMNYDPACYNLKTLIKP